MHAAPAQRADAGEEQALAPERAVAAVRLLRWAQAQEPVRLQVQAQRQVRALAPERVQARQQAPVRPTQREQLPQQPGGEPLLHQVCR